MGIFLTINTLAGRRLEFMHVNCGDVSDRQYMYMMCMGYKGEKVVLLDEAELLDRRLARQLLKPIAEFGTFWIMLTSEPKLLDQVLLRRFSNRLQTTLPTIQELALFIGRRCQHFGIAYDSVDTLVCLAERCLRFGRVSDSIAVLSVASCRERRLTRRLVDGYSFDLARL